VLMAVADIVIALSGRGRARVSEEVAPRRRKMFIRVFESFRRGQMKLRLSQL
jgi:hypothetical protein